MKRIRIGIVDDEILFRKGLKALLEDDPNFDVLFELGNTTTFHKVLQKVQPDVLIIELKLKTQNGVQIAKYVKTHYRHIRIIILTSFYNVAFANSIRRIGVHAFLSKQVNQKELFKAIHEVANNRIFLTEPFKDIILNSNISDMNELKSHFSLLEKLTDRELEVLNLICHEYTNLEISKKLFLSIRTVESHRKSLLSKIGVRNTAGLVLYALTYSLVQIDYKLLQVSINKPYATGYIVH